MIFCGELCERVTYDGRPLLHSPITGHQSWADAGRRAGSGARKHGVFRQRVKWAGMASPGLLPRPVLVAHTALPARDSMEHITFLPTIPSKSSTLPRPRVSEQRLSRAEENKLELYKK